jgi:hypothetical protein
LGLPDPENRITGLPDSTFSFLSSRKERVKYHLDSGGITHLDFHEIKAIFRAADELIATGGRTMLSKILKGSKDKKTAQDFPLLFSRQKVGRLRKKHTQRNCCKSSRLF